VSPTKAVAAAPPRRTLGAMTTQHVSTFDDRDLLGLDHAQVRRILAAAGLPLVHADTVWADVHRRLATDLDLLARTPLRVREALRSAGLRIGTPSIVHEVASTDGFTRKYLLRFADGESVETVLMRFDGRATACLSTQAGCAMGCVFCATGQAGFRRHLAAGEIVAQAVHVARVLAADHHTLRNVVLMGQGEPLHNYDAVVHAMALLTHPGGLAIAGQRITLSTVGVVPGIRRLAEEGRPCSLAVSLHGTTDEERSRLVPLARRWPLAGLMEACRLYTARTGGRRVFFEWTLIDGVNDSTAEALRLAALLSGQAAQVNLIPLNPTAGYSGEPAGNGRVRAFQAALRSRGIPCTVRLRRGIDIAAGCGQLAGSIKSRQTLDNAREA
jgi:23S rRNA (adenine2503-C2)-methyltransferase